MSDQLICLFLTECENFIGVLAHPVTRAIENFYKVISRHQILGFIEVFNWRIYVPLIAHFVKDDDFCSYLWLN